MFVEVWFADSEFITRGLEISRVRRFVRGIRHREADVDDRLGGKLGTEVEPIWSTARARPVSTPTIFSRSISNRRGHSGSYSTITMAAFSGPPMKTSASRRGMDSSLHGCPAFDDRKSTSWERFAASQVKRPMIRSARDR